jgi:hypothetical protein
MHTSTTHNGINNKHSHNCHVTTSANILRISVTGEERNLPPFKDTGKSKVVVHDPHVAHVDVVSCV